MGWIWEVEQGAYPIDYKEDTGMRLIEPGEIVTLTIDRSHLSSFFHTISHSKAVVLYTS